MRRLIREIGQDYKSDLRYTQACMNLLCRESGDRLTHFLKCASMAAKHADRATLKREDLDLVNSLWRTRLSELQNARWHVRFSEEHIRAQRARAFAEAALAHLA